MSEVEDDSKPCFAKGAFLSPKDVEELYSRLHRVEATLKLDKPPTPEIDTHLIDNQSAYCAFLNEIRQMGYRVQAFYRHGSDWPLIIDSGEQTARRVGLVRKRVKTYYAIAATIDSRGWPKSIKLLYNSAIPTAKTTALHIATCIVASSLRIKPIIVLDTRTFEFSGKEEWYDPEKGELVEL